ncbi:MAG: integrin alpha [Nitrosomonas sp.]
MALTVQQQTSLLQLAQVMFNASPGATYLDALGAQLTAGQSLADLAQTLVGTELFLGKDYADDLTSEAFAEAFISDLVGGHASDANKTLATEYIVNRISAGATQGEVIAELTTILSTVPASNADWGAAALAYNTSNAEKIIDNLVGDTVTADQKSAAVNFILVQMASGQTLGAVINSGITLLDGVEHTDPAWGNAAALLDNRIEVSRYYSIEKGGSSTSLSTLQQVLAGVTADAATVATAKTAIDNLLNNSGRSIDLTSLDGSNGFRLDGVITSDDTGESVSGAGDINGDGFDDLIIGAPHNFDDFYSGASFVVFGKASGFNASLPLSTLDGSNGFRLNGVAGGDAAGQMVSRAGDINKDGFDDLLIGSPLSDVPGLDTGYSYVVFGKASGFGATLELSSLDGNNGFRLDGTLDSLTGWSGSSAGDVNGDGFDDLFIGAPLTDLSIEDSGSGYIVFGQSAGFSATMDLTSLDGNNGFRMDGLAGGGQFGNSISAGDINGDGLNDLMIGAYLDSPNGEGSGSSYVIFGKNSGFDAILDISNLDGSNGFRLNGVAEGDQSGYSLSTAGDVNGDGFDDIIIGANYADANGENSGASYVIFGKASGFDATVELSSLDGNNGFRLEGALAGDYSGRSVSTAGDFNGDGFADLIIGAFGAEPNGQDSGSSYLVYGKASGFSASLNLADLGSSDGILLNGLAAGDSLGKSVSSAGDVNNDGFDDLIIGAPFGDGSIPNTGVGYVIFGGVFG